MFVNKDTEIVIEGFPGSANSFAVTAFQLSQSRQVAIGHHTHKSSQIIFAAEENIPAIVLIREPEKAVLSDLLRSPFLQKIRRSPKSVIKNSLVRYISFYEDILPYWDKFIVADFNTVINNFGSVICKINTKFGTSFEEFDHTEENVSLCFKLMDQNILKNRITKNQSPEMAYARPTEARKELARELEKEFRCPSIQPLLKKSNSLYERYIANLS